MSTFDETGQFQGETLNVDEARGFSNFLEEGRYICELAGATGVAASKSSGKPMVTVVWEVVEGENEGIEFNDYYAMSISAPKKPGGKPFAPGIKKLQGDLKAMGDPLPGNFGFPTKDGAGDYRKAEQIIAKKFRGKRVEIAMIKTPQKDKEKNIVRDEAGNVRYDYRPRILGLAGGKAAAADTTDDLGL